MKRTRESDTFSSKTIESTRRYKRKKNKNIVKTVFDCDVFNLIPQCNGVKNLDRILEVRSYCLFKYFVNNYGKKNVFSTYMTLPIILSFADMNDKAITKVIENEAWSFWYSDNKQENKFKQATMDLIGCNRIWNNNMDQKIIKNIKNNIDVRGVWGDSYYAQTLVNLRFVKEVQGVINRPSWVERTEKYVNLDTMVVSNITESNDKFCDNLNSSNCEINNSVCVLRKGKCENKERYSTFSGKNPSYYLLNNEQVDDDDKERLYSIQTSMFISYCCWQLWYFSTIFKVY